MKKYFALPVLFMVILCSLVHSNVNLSNTWPIIIAPSEVTSGKDLIGSAYSPYGGTYVEIWYGGKLIWSNMADSFDSETIFSVRIPRGSVGTIKIEAEDINGNTSTQEVIIT